MDKNIQKAIDIIEAAGGFVMFSEEQLQEIESTHETDEEYYDRKREAFKEVSRVFNEGIREKKGTVDLMNEMEDVLLSEGFDADALEDWIYEQI